MSWEFDAIQTEKESKKKKKLQQPKKNFTSEFEGVACGVQDNTRKLQKLVSLNFAVCDDAGVLLLIHCLCVREIIKKSQNLKLPGTIRL